jgi:FlaA1/EpsC-like NDP-sugar epimerase
MTWRPCAGKAIGIDDSRRSRKEHSMRVKRLIPVHGWLAVSLLILYDVCAVLAAGVLAGVLQDDPARFAMLGRHLASLPVAMATYVLCFYFFRLYHSHWQFAGVEMVWSVVFANLIGTLLFAFWQVQFDSGRMDASMLIMIFLLATALIGGQRLVLRMAASRVALTDLGQPWQDPLKRAVILCSAQSAGEVLMALAKERTRRYEIAGLLDEDPRYHGAYLRGNKILGGFDLLEDLLFRHLVDEVIIALPNTNADQLRQFVLACCKYKVAVRVIPVLAEILENPAAARGRLHVHDVRVEDLLPRPAVETSPQEIGRYLTGQRVLVTGAGGSIGSELCRQIARVNPAALILLGHGENSVVATQRELAVAFPDLAPFLVPVICDIRDADRLTHVIAHYRPQVVFHAAAHKHVPLMEENVAEAVLNNVGGTRCLVKAATAGDVERLVMISTDKAVNPSSVMGATKFLCEEITRGAVERHDTAFVTVRFGNVLGSRGSVLPVFQEQLVRGGPLTITHPEMERFFMTIPEAAALVLHAGALGHSGDLFVLDMGKPVRIIDLAENLIRLSGLEPYRDIDITFCGLRPGEKLTEELFTASERERVMEQGRMFSVDRPCYLSAARLDTAVDELLAIARTQDDARTLAKLREVLPTFRVQPQAAVDIARDEDM